MRSSSDDRTAGLIAYLALTAAVVLWGGSFAAMRSAVGDIGAFGVMSLRSLVATAVLLPFAPGFLRELRRCRRPGDGRLLVFTVLMQPCLYFLFEANALRFTSASQAGVIAAIVPILTAVGAWLVLKEPVGGRVVLGMVMAIAGIVIITFGGNGVGDAPRPLLGNLLEVAAMVCGAANLVAGRGLSRRYGTWLLTALQTVTGAVFFLPGLAMVIRSGIGVVQLPWIPILYLGVGASLGAFGLYNWGMARIPAARASSFINLVPVVAALGGWLFLGEILSPVQIAGSAAVLSGVLLSQKRAKAEPVPTGPVDA